MNFTELYLEAAGADVNIDFIEKIESNNNPKAINKTSGSRGATQIINKRVWDYIVKDMGKSYDWEKDWSDRDINKSVGSHYINVIIPRYLFTYKIPDSYEMRLATYNWGINNVKKAYRRLKDNWKTGLPTETSNYLTKYNKLAGIVQPVVAPKKPEPAKPVTPAKSVVPAKPATPTKSKIPVVHIVRSGDTISHIAKRYKTTLNNIKSLNPGLINLNKIKIGDKIKVL